MGYRYQVIVSNIGTVYDGDNMHEALKNYRDYVKQSNGKFGKAAGETVTLMKANDIWKQHIGYMEREEL